MTKDDGAVTIPTEDRLYYDPFDYDIDDNPYPVWQRMRAEAPLYYNEKYNFYALSRYDDVATAFVDEILAGALGARHVVVGADFCYGRGRAGTVATLTADGARAGFATIVVPPVMVGDRPASSTRARAALTAGDLDGARALLGHGYDVDGVVVRGAGRGKGLGIPTANVAPDGAILASPGIYAVTLARLDRGGAPLPAVASLGTNPTFVEGGGLVLEVHVLDFDADLYGERVRVEFVARLRDEARYDSVAALLAQIDRDIADARARLSGSR